MSINDDASSNSSSSFSQEDVDPIKSNYRGQHLYDPSSEASFEEQYNEISVVEEKSFEDEQNSSDTSIDHIENRIKQLEKDLESRLDKHKISSTSQISHQPKRYPPISSKVVPQKEEKIQEKESKKEIPPGKIDKKILGVENKMEKANQAPSKPISKVIKEPSEVKKYDPDREQIKQKNPSPQRIKRDREQIERLKRQMQSLKAQNKQLKEGKKRKKAVQLVHLQELSAKDATKLGKEIQLLKIINRLQEKLKKSIARKMGKDRATLLHKGLSANLLS